MHKRFSNECKVCHCTLDPNEGNICEDCQEENEQMERLAKKWNMTISQVREMHRKGMVIGAH